MQEHTETAVGRRRRVPKAIVTALGLLGLGGLVGGVASTAMSASAATTSTTSPSGSSSSNGSSGSSSPSNSGSSSLGAAAPDLSQSGTVTAVGSSSVTIQTSSATTTYAVDSNSDIDKNGEAALSNLTAGDAVTFSTVTTNGTNTIDKLHAGNAQQDMPNGGPRTGSNSDSGSSSSSSSSTSSA